MLLKLPDPNQFQFSLFSEPSNKSEIESVIADYRIMLICILDAILKRYEKDPDYHFLDTKLSLLTGKNFDKKDPIRSKTTIYSWIQGRGLEALAGHEIWVCNCKEIDEQLRTQLSKRIRTTLSEVLYKMEELRKINGGKLFFMMTPNGQALSVNKDGQVVPYHLIPGSPSNYSDLFYVKGMAAASYVLGIEDKLKEAGEWFRRIYSDILNDNFVSDQQQLDPCNIALKKAKNRYSHGAHMIGIGATSRFLKCTKDAKFQKIGFEYLDHMFKYHVNLEGDDHISQKYDMWEFIDKNNKPYLNDDGSLLNDPGHACEFVGLALDMIFACEKNLILTDSQKEKIKEYKKILPCILEKNFKNGFSSKEFGICKAFDLISRKTINSDMPWWSLPETMRAAMATCNILPFEKRSVFAEIAAKCSNAFMKHYIKSDLNLMAIQTLDKDGNPIDVVPATPDADPGYHTGLSIIDYLELASI